MFKARVIIGLLLIVSISLCVAEPQKQSKAIGLRLGTSSGTGYSYRSLNNGSGFQFALGAMSSMNNKVKFSNTVKVDSNENEIVRKKTDGRTSVSLGLNWIQALTKAHHTRLYIMAGGSYLYARKTEYEQTYVQQKSSNTYVISGDKRKKIKNSDVWTIGVGPGLEFFTDKNLRVCIEVPTTINSKGEVIPYIPQVGLYYYFD